MITPRHKAVAISATRARPAFNVEGISDALSVAFGTQVFGQRVMKKVLPSEIFTNVERAMAGLEKLNPEYADPIATAMKEWAISRGATHYTHWFLPLTGTSAEKHDSFIDWDSPKDSVIEKFCGKQLLQGEPDASSFPSGLLRTTFEARGYTGWDPSSPAFLWTSGDGVTLFIPSVFFSWTGDVLDHKIPLHRSNHKIESAALRLLRFTGTEATHVFPTLGLEQEYFVIDRALRQLRPDLVLLGKTVFGAPPPKGQELQDHYFGSVKDRILRYMRDFEIAAIQLGIPVKTRHNEVAPAQHEIASVYEEATIAVDHNIILMELMRLLASKHDLACLLNEKPFNGLNGSGKHMNWSLATDTGINLLEPPKNSQESIRFLILLVAIIDAVHRHAALLRASIGSAGNDCRLGGHEAPPAIISVYLGEELEQLLDKIEAGDSHHSNGEKESYDLGIPTIPTLSRDNTDRNRTSPFAFTLSKFEFRAVGSSANVAEPATVLNVIVSESLNEILDEVQTALGGAETPSPQALVKAVMPVLVKVIKRSKAIRFNGDNYSEEWKKEAENRELPNVSSSSDAFDAYLLESTARVCNGVLTEAELRSRHNVLLEAYSNNRCIEAKLMVELFRTMILPGALKYQKELAESITAVKEAGIKKIEGQQCLLDSLSKLIEEGISCADHLLEEQECASALDGEACGKMYGTKVREACNALRNVVDQLEGVVNDTNWPLPKYRELLFFI